MLDIDFDRRYDSYGVVCGTDEAGRGPLCGPVVAGACILPKEYVPDGLDDSKKLSEKKREKLFDEITSNALSYGIGVSTAQEIDEMNILNASLLAMRRAIENLNTKVDFILVDGCITRGFDIPCQAVVGGDALSPSIAAASIIAKVTRDRLMIEMDEKFPQYGLKKHKGYPTKAHKLAVYKYGPCEEHRRSFLSFLEKEKEKLEAEIKKAEIND